MSQIEKISAGATSEKLAYTAKTQTTGGRDGASRSSDGRLDIKLSIPGGPGAGTNPEQLFAAGWSACFEGAMAIAVNKRVELKFGYLNNSFEFWGPYLSGNLSSSIFGPSGAIPIESGLNAFDFTTPSIDIKINGPIGIYDKLGVQRASSPDGPVTEKTANPRGVDWSTPNSGILVINEFGYRKDAAPDQLATWVRAAPMVNTSRYVDFEFGGRRTGDYAGYFLADQQFIQLSPARGQSARCLYAGVTAMYALPEFNRVSQYYEFPLYGIGLLPSRPRDLASLVISRSVFSNYLVDAALQRGQLAHADSSSVTAAYIATLAPGIRAGIGLGYTNHPTPVIYAPHTGSALNILANLTTFW